MSKEKAALDKVRELLDERGVHYISHGGEVRWVNDDGCVCRAWPRANPSSVDVAVTPPSTGVSMAGVTPEQAVGATCLFEPRIAERKPGMEVGE